MAVRLQMRLGVVAEQDRLPDSPDRIVVVEPSIGSIARSKGSLYLLVTGQGTGGRLREATRLVAEAIRDQYYYDESAGIRVCVVKAVAAANKRLAHQRERFSIPIDEAGNGPIGVAVAIVRGNELYVSTVGPAEAYLIRQARLSTLPDPHRERGLPTADLQPDVWRGEMGVGDSLVLVTPNVVARLGPDELKDAMLTLHPQSAMEHLHHRFVAADGSGSDGALAIEATEVAATTKQRSLVPVRPSEPLAGAPDRSPIPLADTVTDGVAAVQASARQARSVAGGALSRLLWRIQDLLPQRGPRYRKVTPLSARRETQQRAAFALLAFVGIAATLGFVIYLNAGAGKDTKGLQSLSAGQAALQNAQGDLSQVFAPGVDLVTDDPNRALTLLTDAYHQLDTASGTGVPASTIGPLRLQVVGGLDRLWHVVPVAAKGAFSFPTATPAVDLVALVRGPDGAAYVIDRGSKTVYRIDPRTRKAAAILRAGQTALGTKAAEPKFLAVGGPDVLILDAKNVLWRWIPADTKGRGTLNKVNVRESSSWGADVRGFGTFERTGSDPALYNLYVVDPSERQVLRYSPFSDGSGYSGTSTGYLATAQDVSQTSDLFIDGNVYMVDQGVVERFVAGRSGDWSLQSPGDDLLRPAPKFRLVTSPTTRDQGNLYAYDPASQRVIAYDKATGHFIEQYRVAGGSTAWADVRAMFVTLGAEGDPPTIWWITDQRLFSALLQAVPDQPTAGPSPSPSPSSSQKASAKPSVSARPSRSPASPRRSPGSSASAAP